MMGIEPTTFGTTTRRSNQMSYIRQIRLLLYHVWIDKTRVVHQFALGETGKEP